MTKFIDDINPNAVAVIGMACRFPGAKNIDEFWHNLKNGIESISFFSEEEVVESGIDIAIAKNVSLIKAFGVLEESDKFDAEFFGFSPREAELLDPQNRMFLECAWEAFENASYDTNRFDGRVGVYASSSLSTYLLKNLLSNKETLISVGGISAQLGNDKDHVPTRVSYAMNLKGPSIAIGTACSSSLVAVHLACQGLLDFHCDMALTGGVTVHANQSEGYFYNHEGTASPDGHCRTFDSNSGGTISGCGAGAVVLKRLADAIKDNDNIYAIVLSSAVNNDGAVKVSYTAPGIDGQSEIIAEAHNLADIDPETISYVETHGTATNLGDPIEIAALKKAFSSVKNKKAFCALGSVKSNVGHLDSAAGIAGFIKTVLSLKNKQIPPSLHFENPNPALNISDSPFFVNNKLTDWKTNRFPLRAGVSSFAMGGTNAHVILQEFEEDVPDKSEAQMCIILISAKTENVLASISINLFKELNIEAKRINDIAYTLQMGRKPFRFRKTIVASNISSLLKELESDKSINTFTGIADNSNIDIVFMFSGLGSHYVNMGLDLFNNNKVFRNSLLLCSSIFNKLTGNDLISIIYPDGISDIRNVNENTGIDFLQMVRGDTGENKSGTKLDETIFAHPAIFSIEYALTQMCFELGIKPSVLIGHSIGEYTALCISGALGLEDTLKLISERARILNTVQHGEMLTVDTKEENLKQYLTGSLSLAAVNDFSSCVISGLKYDIDALKIKLNLQGIVHRSVRTQHAFHSKLIEGKKEDLYSLFKQIRFGQLSIPIISCSTGDWLTDNEITNPDYLVSHTTNSVRFFAGINKLFTEKYIHFLEIGPGQNLAGFVLKSYPKDTGKKIFVRTIMKNVYDSQPDYEYFMRTVAKLWTSGIDINWEYLYKGYQPKRIPLPTYPFENKRYWIDEKIISDDAQSLNVTGGISYLTWNKSFSSGTPIDNLEDDNCWLIFREPNRKTDNLTDLMKKKGIRYITILLSDTNNLSDKNQYSLNVNNRYSFGKLFNELEKKNIKYRNILYVPFSDIKESSLDKTGHIVIQITELLKILSLSDKNINLAFFLENAFNITGSEIISPANAALYGLIKSIQDEYKSINTYCFEYSQLTDNNQYNFYSNLISSIITNSEEIVTAFRGRSKWIPCYNQLSSSSRNVAPNIGKKILVLGNNHKLKNIIINELNENKSNQIILGLDSSEIPVDNNDDFITWIEKQIDNNLSIKSLDEYKGLHNKLDNLCGIMAANYLSSLCDWIVGKEYSVDMLRLKVVPKHRKFFDYLLNVASADDYISVLSDNIQILKGLNDIDKPEILAAGIGKEYPVADGIIKLLDYAVSNYPDVFSGKMDNVNVFNNNESESFGDLFQITPLRHEKQKVYINTARELLKLILIKCPDRKINILEVGGGTGKLTGNLLADLADKNIEYHFTDIGKSFLVDAKKLAELLNIDFMKFDKFDISQEPQKQGIELSKYDIVLAYDVIHATENVAVTMKNLELVTAPGGIMIIVEALQPRRWTNMTWGLQTGWWYFNDFRNNIMSPLLTLDEWDSILSKLNLSFCATYPVKESRRSSTAFGLIVLQKPGAADKNTIDINNLCKISEMDKAYDLAVDKTYNCNLSGNYDLTEEFIKIKKEHGQVDSIYLCLNNCGSIPVILRDYEHHKDVAGYQINSINRLINSIKDSGLLNGNLNILFDRPKTCFKADESIVSEYINSLTGSYDFDITSVFVDINYQPGSGEMRITDVTEKLSSTQIFFAPGNYGKVKDIPGINAANGNNNYSRPELSNNYIEPQNDAEIILTEIWKVMFGIGQIGIDDNFIELGGDSLMATKLISRIKQEFNILINIPDFFQNPTIKEIAAKIISDKNMLNDLTLELEGNNDGREEGEI
jgi:acyl transferase domain-containing protein/2-polyprenyl-3-methyl-5-hydroxy-6-metoxy-1,4-benzoquinol methylase/acyl carrier protein